MADASVLWVAAMFGYFVLNFISAAADGRRVGGYVLDDFGNLTSKSDHFVVALIGSLIGALCCPSIPYFVAMVVLAVLHFAMKKD